MRDSELYRRLIEYSRSEAYPFHMPGHKRQVMTMEDPYRFDLTEIDGFDNLHEAEELLKDAQEKAAALYGSDESHFMINGSTGGILSAIGGTVHRGDRVLVARNCHKSVYHALELNGLRPVYLWPELDEGPGIYRGVTATGVEAMLEAYPDIRAVIFTSPTYEGVLSDVKGICEAAHRRGIPCVVDEAHGAHLRWIGLPDAVSSGADVVIQSLHKTLPALTQTALIHINGMLVSRERIRKMLAVYQTSSPSYVLMASISQCLSWISQEGQEMFARYRHQVSGLRRRLKDMKHLYLYETKGNFDWGKLVICTDRSMVAGRWLYDCLREEYALQMEMASARYVLAMTTVGDTKEGFDRLAKSLETIDASGPLQAARMGGTGTEMVKSGTLQWIPERRMEIDTAAEAPAETVKLEMSAGRIMADYLYLYPPGVPILVPGEVIQMKHIECIQSYLRQGLDVHGGYVKESGNVKVILHHG